MDVFIFHFWTLFHKPALSVLQLFFFFLLPVFSVLQLDFLNIWRRLKLLLHLSRCLSVCVRNSRERWRVLKQQNYRTVREKVTHPSSGSQRSASCPPPSPWWRTITHPSVITHNYHVTSHCWSRDLWPLPVLIQAADDVIPLLDDWQQARHQLMLLMSVVGAPVLLWESHTHSQSATNYEILRSVHTLQTHSDVLLRSKQNSHWSVLNHINTNIFTCINMIYCVSAHLVC